MALSGNKTWLAGEILTAADLNDEFSNLYNNGLLLVFPATGAVDFNAKELILDGDTSIQSDVADQIDFRTGGTDTFIIDGSVADPITGLTLIAGATGVEATLQTHDEDDRGLHFEAKNDEEMLKLTPVASAVNEIEITSAIADANPIIASSGDTADTGIEFHNEQGEEILVLEPVATGINHLEIGNAASGNNPTIACTGDEADQGITFQNQAGEEILILDSVDISVNEVTITSAISTSGPIIASTGGDADPDLNINTKGDGNVVITGGATGTVDLGNAALSFPNADGAANTVLKSDGSATLALAALTYAAGPAAISLLPLPRGHLAGLKMTQINAGGSGEMQDISITVGQARGGTSKDGANFDLANLVLTSTLVKQIDAAWSVGTNAGGYGGAGAIATGTWYHFFLIEDDAGTTDAGWDDSIDCTNLLSTSSYTNFRRLGSVLTDGTAADEMQQWLQLGDRFLWDKPVEDVDEAISADPAETKAISVPPGIASVAFANVHETGGLYAHSPDVDDGDPSYTVSPGMSMFTTDNSHGRIDIEFDTSQQIDLRTLGGQTTQVFTLGWIDRRGKDD